MPNPREENVVALPTAFRRPEPPVPPSSPPASAGPLLVPFPRWQKACERVSAALLGGDTRVVVTGPPGTGKTLLLDHTARVLRAAGWTVTMRLADAAPPPAQPGRVAVLVDEADRLSREALQHLLAATPGPLVLAGLDPLPLHLPDATQITLGPLTREEARDFIASWLVLAGRSPENLAADAMRRAVELSHGVPRLLSTLLGAASWLAESSDATVIALPHVAEAAVLRSCFAPEADEPAAVAERAATASGRAPGAALVATSMLLLGIAAFVTTHFYPLELQRAFTTLRRMAERSLPARRDTAETKSARDAALPVHAPTAAPSGSSRPEVARARRAAPLPPLQAVETPPPAPTVAASAAPLAPPADAPLANTPAAPTITASAAPIAPPPAEPAPLATASAAPSIAAPLAPSPAEPPPAEPAPPAKAPRTTVANAAPLEPLQSALPAAMISLLLQRGQDMMGIGDIVAARLLFGRAADSGNAEAMLDMGKTYDPAVLAEASPLLEADPAQARRWYRRAVKAGNQEAAERLRQLGPDGH